MALQSELAAICLDIVNEYLPYLISSSYFSVLFICLLLGSSAILYKE